MPAHTSAARCGRAFREWGSEGEPGSGVRPRPPLGAGTTAPAGPGERSLALGQGDAAGRRSAVTPAACVAGGIPGERVDQVMIDRESPAAESAFERSGAALNPVADGAAASFGGYPIEVVQG